MQGQRVKSELLPDALTLDKLVLTDAPSKEWTNTVLSNRDSIESQKIHRLVFGKTYEELRKDFDLDSEGAEDDSGRIKGEWGHTFYALERLESVNPEEYQRFISKLEKVEGLDGLDFIVRCRLIYTLIAASIDWKDTRAGRIGGYDTIVEMPYSTVPQLDLDFQGVVDSVRQFRPSAGQAKAWGEAFSHGLMLPKAPPPEAAGIVRGAGTKVRMRKKRGS